MASVQTASSRAALAPRWRQLANRANTSRYRSVRLAPSHASPGAPAQMIDAKLSAE